MIKVTETDFLKKPYIVLALMMIVFFFIDMITGQFLTHNGGAVYPRTFHGLSGILFSTLLHGNYSHLSSNFLPFLFLGFFLSKSLKNSQFYGMFFFITIFSGFMVWLLGSASFHLGASSVIFGMWSLILTFAIKRKTFKDMLIGTLVLLGYGMTFIFGLIPTEGISFSGHFWGLVGGVIFGVMFVKSEKIDKK